MSPYSITRDDPERDLRALRAVLSGFPVSISSSAIPALQELADSIEEQVKPAEPIEFGSVVRVRSGTRYVRLGAAQALPWGSGEQMRSWDQLDVIEVLRIGVGADPILDRLADSPRLEDARAEGYNDGVEATKSAAVSLLLIKRERAITGERKDAYEKAIADIESIEALS